MILEAQNLAFSYGKDPVLTGISCRLEPGKVVFLIGGNGSGKSTLLKLLAGGLTPASGEVKIDGITISDISRRRISSHIGVVRQLTLPVFDYTVREFVLFGRNAKLTPWGGVSSGDMAAVERALEKTALTEYRDRIANTLSGGEFQRLVLAAALALEGEFLLLDEPLSAQDPAFAQRLMRRLKKEAENRAVLVISHDLMMAEQFADEVWMLAGGKFLACGKPNEVFTPENIGKLFNCRVLPGTGALKYDLID